ncbi:MAG: TrmH family RNA methyltransferase [Bdellovibrionota bacterium]
MNFILLPKDRQVKLTNASVATSQGGFSLVELFCVTNLVRSLKKLKEMDYWIIGADMGGEDYKDVAGFYDKTVLVLGSEGSGLSHIVRKSCDRIVAIGGREDGLESLKCFSCGWNYH